MLDWLKTFIESAAGLVPSPVRSLINWSLEALGGLFGTITFNVSGAWHELAVGLDALRAGTADFCSDLIGQVETVVTHWIPRYAITAWWWVTHPDQLALVLLWHVLRWAEHYAWTVAAYLGKFTLALLVRNVHRVAALAEEILAAIL